MTTTTDNEIDWPKDFEKFSEMHPVSRVLAAIGVLPTFLESQIIADRSKFHSYKDKAMAIRLMAKELRRLADEYDKSADIIAYEIVNDALGVGTKVSLARKNGVNLL
jgi:hypothetical protein